MSPNPTPACVSDVALVFEGGGMRASYTSGMVNTLIEAGLAFPFVGGISAGSSNTVNYLLGDTWRTRVSFTDLVLDRRFGGIGTFLRGKGYFNSDWIYRQACLPNNAIPYDFARFQSNPAELAIQGFDRDTGESVVWHRDSIGSLDDLMARVQASSSLPLAMPPVRIDGHTYYDGGLGEGGGIPLHLATQAGYTRVLAVLTRPKGYRKRPPSATSRFVANLYRRYPAVRDALLTRRERYNAALDELEAMAAQGNAYIFYSDRMAVENSTTDHAAVVQSYRDGYAQAQAELPAIREWLGTR